MKFHKSLNFSTHTLFRIMNIIINQFNKLKMKLYYDFTLPFLAGR